MLRGHKPSLYIQLLIDEARKLGISVRTMEDLNDNVAILRYGNHQEVLYQALTDRTGAATARLVGNKPIAHQLLLDHGFPTPPTIHTENIEDCQTFLEKHARIVLKPIGHSGGKGVTANITTMQQLATAFAEAQSLTKSTYKTIVCQAHMPGDDYRLLVINKQDVFAVKRVPAYVTGDGIQTIFQLIEHWNQELVVLNRTIVINDKLVSYIQDQGLTLETVPAAGQVVQLASTANSHTGGIIIDATEVIHPSVNDMAIQIASTFNLDVIGIDLITNDVTRVGGTIIELNINPGLSIHHFPTYGKPRNPAQKIINMLFPELQ